MASRAAPAGPASPGAQCSSLANVVPAVRVAVVAGELQHRLVGELDERVAVVLVQRRADDAMSRSSPSGRGAAGRAGACGATGRRWRRTARRWSVAWPCPPACPSDRRMRRASAAALLQATCRSVAERLSPATTRRFGSTMGGMAARSEVMVGRDTEVSLLLGALSRAQTGEAQLALVTGEAGIGKTRLVRELVARVPNGTVVAFGHAMPLSGGSLPYGVVADLLRWLVREVHRSRGGRAGDRTRCWHRWYRGLATGPTSRWTGSPSSGRARTC